MHWNQSHIILVRDLLKNGTIGLPQKLGKEGYGMETRVLALTLIALLALTLVSPAIATSCLCSNGHSEEDHVYSIEPYGAPESDRGYRNLSYEKVLGAFYAVRNETLDLLNWAMGKGSKWAEKIALRAEYHYNKSLEYRDIDPRMATAHLLIATLVYARSPVVAYEVLVRTLNESTWYNGTRRITNETVIAVHEIANELKTLLVAARDYALSINVSLPITVEIHIALGDELLTRSMEKLNENKTRQALALAIKGYRHYVIAYNIVVRRTVSEELGVTARTWYTLAYRLGIYSVGYRERLAMFINKLPEKIKLYILNKIGTPASYEELKARIQQLVREYKEKWRTNIREKITEMIMHRIKMIVRMKPGLIRLIKQKFGGLEGLRDWIRSKVQQLLEQGYSIREIINRIIHYLRNQFGEDVGFIIIICPRG